MILFEHTVLSTNMDVLYRSYIGLLTDQRVFDTSVIHLVYIAISNLGI